MGSFDPLGRQIRGKKSHSAGGFQASMESAVCFTHSGPDFPGESGPSLARKTTEQET